MTTTDTVYGAIARRADDRGYCRTTLDDLAVETELSRSTIKRIIDQLEETGRLRRRSKPGPSGGLLLRLELGSESGSESGSHSVHREPNHHVVPQGTGPEGALSPLLPEQFGSQSGSPAPVAYRPARPFEVPESGANIVYETKGDQRKWFRLTATLWQAPNGDTVSIRSMTPELRLRLRVGINDDGSPDEAALRAVRSILEP